MSFKLTLTLLVFTLFCCISNPLIAQDGGVDEGLETDLEDDGFYRGIQHERSVQDFTIPQTKHTQKAHREPADKSQAQLPDSNSNFTTSACP